MPLYPQSAASQGACPNFLLFRYFHLGLPFESIKEVGSASKFKVTFSTMVFELELKYGVNYTEAFAFKQLARYMHYDALDVYEQHSPRILGVT
jgi:hypothetical protein